MTALSFIHAADLHLDAPFKGLNSQLLSSSSHSSTRTKKLSHILRLATFTALDRLVNTCIRERVDFLLLAGDIYNSSDSSLKARLALRDAFLTLGSANINVILAHGNHDPYTVKDSAIPWPENVTECSGEYSAHRVFKSTSIQEEKKSPLAIVHSISHCSAKENRNLARLFKREAPTLTDGDPFQIGLLHCALAEAGGAQHENYAPCSFSDLATADLNYWALGHVHACKIFEQKGKISEKFECENPLAAYSGSLQGLHVNESGPHGCLLGRVESNGRFTLRKISLAAVQWEQIVVTVDETITSVPLLESILLEKLESLGPQYWDYPSGEAPQAVISRLVVAGRSPLDPLLRKNGTVETLLEHINTVLEGADVWLRDISITTRPLIDIEITKDRPDLAGETLRTALTLGKDDEALTAFGREALEPLFRRVKVRRAIQEPENEELKSLTEEAVFLCLDLLGVDSQEDAESIMGGDA